MIPFRCETLDNGVTVAFFDQSNRYFGDYHRVRVEARICVTVFARAEPMCKVRMLERMGVAGAEVTIVRDRLVDDFWRHAADYLGRADYPARLLAAEQGGRRQPAGVSHLHGH